MYAYLDADRNVLALSTEARTVETVQVKCPTVTTRIDSAPDAVKAKGNCTITETQYHRLKEGAGGQVIGDYDVFEDVTALQAYRIAQVSAKNDELFAKGALYDGKRFAITKDDHAGWLALVMIKDSLPNPYQVYTINPPEAYLIDPANLPTLVFGVLFPRCTEIYATGQVLDDAITAATTKAAIDAIVDDRE